MSRRLAIGAVIVTALGCWIGPAAAHAELVSSQPASGAVLQAPPSAVTLTFDEPVEPVPRAIVMTTDLGVPVSTGTPEVRGASLVAQLQDQLGPGRYVVGWRARADDGHVIDGSFSFSVTAAAGAGAPRPAPVGSAPLPGPLGQDDPIWPVIVAAAVALAAGLGAGFVVRRGLRELAANAPSYSVTQDRGEYLGDNPPIPPLRRP